MNYAKPVAMAFLVGGIFAVIGQAITMFWLPIVGDSPFLGFAILVSMGVIGVALFLTGAHQKLAPIAGFGLVLPFNGFCAAISDTFVNASAASGEAGEGVKASLKLLAFVLGWGCLSIFVIAAATFFIKGLM